MIALPRRLLLSLALTACVGGFGESSGPSTQIADRQADVIDDPSDTVYRLRAVGPMGEAPAELVIQLRRNRFAADAVGTLAPEGTTFTVEPPLPGRLEVLAPNALRFVPEAPLAPGARHTFTLTALGGGEAPALPPSPGLWSSSLESPAFGFVRADLRARDPKKGEATIDLVFSHAVDPQAVAAKARFSLGGAAVTVARVEPGPRASVVRVSLRSARLGKPGELVMSLAAGVPYADEAATTAEAGVATLPLTDGPVLGILNVSLREGRDGYSIEVVCNDAAAGGERYWWDPETYDGWWTSRRCALDPEEAKRVIQIEPAVPFTLADGPAGFRILGDFSRGPVSLHIAAGARSRDGGVLPAAWSSALTVPERSPRVTFTSKGRYLPREAWKNLAVEHINLDTATLTVRHVPAENLVFWLSGSEESMDLRTSVVVLQREVALPNTPDVRHTTWVDVASLLPKIEGGVYELRITPGGIDKAGERGPTRGLPRDDAARVVITDLALVAKRERRADGSHAVRAWALQSKDNRAASEVEVKLVRPSGQVLARCTTGRDGACVLEAPADPLDPTGPMALIASKAGELTYLKFSELALSPEGDVSGLPYALTAGEDAPAWRAAVYPDRGAYRPGDTVHLAAILRDADYEGPKAAMPAVVRFTDPRGKELRRIVGEVDGAGLITADLRLGDFALTGSYRASVSVADREAGAVTFRVDEFVPERLSLVAKAVAPEGTRVDEPARIDIEGRWLFGGSAAGSKVELSCTARSTPFTPAENDEYHYGPAELDGEGPAREATLGTTDGVLDEAGKAQLSCPPGPPGVTALGAATLTAEVRVTEGETGRATRRLVSAPLHPADHYIGLRSSTLRAEANRPLSVEGVLVTPKGALSASAAAQVEVEIFRLDEEFGWWWDEDAGETGYRRSLRRSRVSAATVPTQGGRFVLPFTPEEGVGWLIVARAGAAWTELHIPGAGGRYAWGYADGADRTPRPERPAPLRLRAPERVRSGEAITVTAKAPYAGRLLWSVETDEVVKTEWVEAEAGEVSFTYTPREFEPNVYISALLLKDPHLESDQSWLPERAAGLTSVRIEPTDYTAAVSIKAPESVLPNSPLTIELSAEGLGRGPASATVAIVDEGILSLTNFQSPDPAEQIFARRALGVESFETIGWSMVSAPRGPASRVGGDAAGANGRVQMVKPVALWSGKVDLVDGKAKVTVDVPGYRGKLRVMAVVASAEKMGHASANVVVKEPVVLMTTLPRFLVAGDDALVPVTLTNTTEAEKNVTVRLSGESLRGGPSPVRLLGAEQGAVRLAPGESRTVVFTLRAERAPAAVRLRASVEGKGVSTFESLELPIQPALPETRRTQRSPLAAGDTDVGAALVSAGWLPGSDQSRLWVTANAEADALSHLAYVAHYPYGCVEQTTSATRALLYVSQAADQLDPGLGGASSVDDMIRAGIERIATMQTPSGGFSYWPGGEEPHLWGTAYAVHLLLDAKEAGHAIPEALVPEALRYLAEAIGQRDAVDPSGELAYTHYVLAKGGQAQPAAAANALDHLAALTEAERKERFGTWAHPEESRYLLAAALYLSGDRRHEKRLRAVSSKPLTRSKRWSWSWYTDLRHRALELSVYTELFGVKGGEGAAAAIGEVLRDTPSERFTTQELGWALTALGRRSAVGAGSLPAISLLREGTPLKREHDKGDPLWAIAQGTLASALTLRVEAEPPSPLYLITQTTGVLANAPDDDLAAGLRLERAWRKADGQPADLAAVTLGDRLYVHLTVSNLTDDRAQNLALVDRLPAGFEIEEARVGAELPWLPADTVWQSEHQNSRDDRVEIFGTLSAKETRQVVYVVRAVTAGSFTLPSARLEAMYDPDQQARDGGAMVAIRGPWEGLTL